MLGDDVPDLGRNTLRLAQLDLSPATVGDFGGDQQGIKSQPPLNERCAITWRLGVLREGVLR